MHRDLKPENIFLTRTADVKILDFGIAKMDSRRPPTASTLTVAGGTGTGAGVILGTVGYMAPEQATGRSVDFRCDQFSFGIVVYEMLSGRRAFQRASHVEELAAIVRDEHPTLSEVHPDAPLPLQWLLDRCLAKNPAERMSRSNRDLHRDLEKEYGSARRAATVACARQGAAAFNVPVSKGAYYRTGHGRRQSSTHRAPRLGSAGHVHTVPAASARPAWRCRWPMKLKAQFDGGVYFRLAVDAHGSDPVPQAVAHAFGVSQSPPIEGIREYLTRGADSSADAVASRQLRTPARRGAICGGPSRD